MPERARVVLRQRTVLAIEQKRARDVPEADREVDMQRDEYAGLGRAVERRVVRRTGRAACARRFAAAEREVRRRVENRAVLVDEALVAECRDGEDARR